MYEGVYPDAKGSAGEGMVDPEEWAKRKREEMINEGGRDVRHPPPPPPHHNLGQPPLRQQQQQHESNSGYDRQQIKVALSLSAHTQIHTHAHTRIHTRAHTYTRTRTHAQTNVRAHTHFNKIKKNAIYRSPLKLGIWNNNFLLCLKRCLLLLLLRLG